MSFLSSSFLVVPVRSDRGTLQASVIREPWYTSVFTVVSLVRSSRLESKMQIQASTWQQV